MVAPRAATTRRIANEHDCGRVSPIAFDRHHHLLNYTLEHREMLSAPSHKVGINGMYSFYFSLSSKEES